jgi:aldose 1-epimerase
MTHVWTHDRSHSSSAARRLVPGLLGAVSLAIGATGALAASVEKSSYGATKAGDAVDVYTLKNDTGATVKFISYGGIITDIDVPDRGAGSATSCSGSRTSLITRLKIPILAR